MRQLIKSIFIIGFLITTFSVTENQRILITTYAIIAPFAIIYLSVKRYGVAKTFIFFSALAVSLMICLSISNALQLGVGILTCSVPALVIASIVSYFLFSYNNKKDKNVFEKQEQKNKK
tara:strand:- start:95597 stop:95953 length:357 start_codon:yes stop_codon:yes gene_type:complete